MKNTKTTKSPAGRYDIEVSNHQTVLKVGPRTLPKTARLVLRHFGVARANLSIVLVDTPTIRQLKKKYFGRSQDTDVISFDLRDSACSEEHGLDIEVVINAQRALALTQTTKAATTELHLYLVHGLLHQLGFNDDTPAHARCMHQQEDTLLEQLGWGRPFYQHPPLPQGKPQKSPRSGRASS